VLERDHPSWTFATENDQHEISKIPLEGGGADPEIVDLLLSKDVAPLARAVMELSFRAVKTLMVGTTRVKGSNPGILNVLIKSGADPKQITSGPGSSNIRCPCINHTADPQARPSGRGREASRLMRRRALLPAVPAPHYFIAKHSEVCR
jgi:hypothetical protein